MKVLLQRVNSASVRIAEETVSSIPAGLLLLVGFGKEDTESCLAPMVDKVVNLRIFPDENGRFHFSVKEAGGAILAVPQFTLYGETKKGRRPDFFNALDPDIATLLFTEFCTRIEGAGIADVRQGVFGAYMQVALENDGPVTLMLEN